MRPASRRERREPQVYGNVESSRRTLPPDHSVASPHTRGLAPAIAGGWVGRQGSLRSVGWVGWDRTGCGGVDSALMKGRQASLRFGEAGRAGSGPCPGLRQKAGRWGGGLCVCSLGHPNGMMKQYGNWH